MKGFLFSSSISFKFDCAKILTLLSLHVVLQLTRLSISNRPYVFSQGAHFSNAPPPGIPPGRSPNLLPNSVIGRKYVSMSVLSHCDAFASITFLMSSILCLAFKSEIILELVSLLSALYFLFVLLFR